ncbi:MAG TPA: HPF/RaiA family ribosome-associated protein [Steroidobacteraceae bacterium]|nr:HPF/RaiA family ribosome-associated protein [Steroidobacteraceae bacterium]
MQVQVNHDNHVRIGAEVSQRLTQVLESSLSQFTDRITRIETRIELHLGDENAGKHGDSDKRCMIEARLRNLEPIAVTHQAESLQLAFEGALEKLDHALSHAVGKLETY